MPKIEIKTEVRAPIDRVFDLTRSIDIYTLATSETKEKAIAGETRGLMDLDEAVVFEATHLGFRVHLALQITQMTSPTYFQDKLVEGPFRSFQHDHNFTAQGDLVLMHDVISYSPLYGPLGHLFSFFFLKGYIRRFFKRRHLAIKEIAEGRNWKLYLPLS